MKTIDRRRLISAILCGAGSAMVLAPEALAAMPIDTKVGAVANAVGAGSEGEVIAGSLGERGSPPGIRAVTEGSRVTN
jgi:hypothetical protein